LAQAQIVCTEVQITHLPSSMPLGAMFCLCVVLAIFNPAMGDATSLSGDGDDKAYRQHHCPGDATSLSGDGDGRAIQTSPAGAALLQSGFIVNGLLPDPVDPHASNAEPAPGRRSIAGSNVQTLDDNITWTSGADSSAFTILMRGSHGSSSGSEGSNVQTLSNNSTLNITLTNTDVALISINGSRTSSAGQLVNLEKTNETHIKEASASLDQANFSGSPRKGHGHSVLQEENSSKDKSRIAALGDAGFVAVLVLMMLGRVFNFI